MRIRTDDPAGTSITLGSWFSLIVGIPRNFVWQITQMNMVDILKKAFATIGSFGDPLAAPGLTGEAAKHTLTKEPIISGLHSIWEIYLVISV